MKKNLKIGMGLAMVSLVSMASVIPVFADVKPNYVEKTGTAIISQAESTVSETAAAETGKEESGKQAEAGIDFAKSPNLCKLYHDDKTMEEKEPEAKPSDFKDEAIRQLAEKYAKKGYFLADVKFAATHYSSGIGFENEYVFCNGFSASDDNTGNNKEFIQVVKATPAEFNAFMSVFGGGNPDFKKGSVVTYKMDDTYRKETISYDEDTQVMIVAIKLLAKNAVG
ncbi:MAG: hypothetical protein IKH20_03660 [Clostridiales bacterium]|nr:hypothetical protein [Clostridiales bacterium]